MITWDIWSFRPTAIRYPLKWAYIYNDNAKFLRRECKRWEEKNLCESPVYFPFIPDIIGRMLRHEGKPHQRQTGCSRPAIGKLFHVNGLPSLPQVIRFHHVMFALLATTHFAAHLWHGWAIDSTYIWSLYSFLSFPRLSHCLFYTSLSLYKLLAVHVFFSLVLFIIQSIKKDHDEPEGWADS